MSKDELIEFLKKYMYVELVSYDDRLSVKISIDNVTICEDEIYTGFAEKYHNHDD